MQVNDFSPAKLSKADSIDIRWVLELTINSLLATAERLAPVDMADIKKTQSSTLSASILRVDFSVTVPFGTQAQVACAANNALVGGLLLAALRRRNPGRWAVASVEAMFITNLPSSTAVCAVLLQRGDANSAAAPTAGTSGAAVSTISSKRAGVGGEVTGEKDDAEDLVALVVMLVLSAVFLVCIIILAAKLTADPKNSRRTQPAGGDPGAQLNTHNHFTTTTPLSSAEGKGRGEHHMPPPHQPPPPLKAWHLDDPLQGGASTAPARRVRVVPPAVQPDYLHWDHTADAALAAAASSGRQQRKYRHADEAVGHAYHHMYTNPVFTSQDPRDDALALAHTYSPHSPHRRVLV